MEYTFSQYQESAEALKDRLGAFRRPSQSPMRTCPT